MFIERVYSVNQKEVQIYTESKGTKTDLYLLNTENQNKVLMHKFSLDVLVSINKTKNTITLKTYSCNKPFFNTFKKVLDNAITDLLNPYTRIFRLYTVHFPARYSISKYLEILNFRGNKTSVKIKQKQHLSLEILENHRLKVTGLSRIHVLNYFEEIKQKLKPLGDSRIFIDTILLEPL